ncbi:MAG: aromatic amino acid lyase [Muribaculaceae bacterium]|nr:aromatic amino acid lyase [Muribaculaceae bacterium]MDD6701313.1 aromatic amino acid ammonia-lyase [Bacteroidales bacterium]
MKLSELYDIIFDGRYLSLPADDMDRVERCYQFLRSFANDKVIYGINTGFGPMAQWRVDDSHLKELQYNIIRSHATGAGEPLSDIQVKAAMIVRIGTFLQARSGIHPSVINLLQEFVNRGIYPYIPQHGSVGASGDLVQLAHIALCLIGEGKVHYQGVWRNSREVLNENNLQPMQIFIREGLSVTNGTSVMTGISIVNQYFAENLLKYATIAGAWINEIADSFDDYMSVEENICRRQPGQQVIAQWLRQASEGSRHLQKREHELYDPSRNKDSYFYHKVQAYYSLRCLPQIYGPIYDTLMNAANVIQNEVNSACDNPIVDYTSQNIYHGGNFHGDYISLEADKVKIAMVRLAMTAERQLNYLFHDRINGILPPFLNLGVLGLNYGMQACQFTATSTTAECQTLAMPNYVHSIPNNNDNQDIVSMGTNSALLCQKVIDNAYQVVAILFIALAQATDVLNIANMLAPISHRYYNQIRNICPKFIDDTPFYDDIANVEHYLRTNIIDHLTFS